MQIKVISVLPAVVSSQPLSDDPIRIFCVDAGEEGTDIKGEKFLVRVFLQCLDLLNKIDAILNIVLRFSHAWTDHLGEVFGCFVPNNPNTGYLIRYV